MNQHSATTPSVLLHLALDYMKSRGTTFTTYGTSAINPALFMYLKAGAEVRGAGVDWFRKVLVGA
jgi:hypothetical protein